MPQHPLHRGPTELVRIELDLDAKTYSARVGGHGDREVRAFVQLHYALRPGTTAALHHLAEVEVLEDENAVEQWLTLLDVTPRLHAAERCVLVLTHVHPLLAQFYQELPEWFLRVERRPHRQRVDEQTNGIFDIVDR